MPEFITILQMSLQSEDYVAAISEADDVKIAVEKLLDNDLGECIDVLETIEAGEKTLPQEQILQLRQSRNILLRHRSKESYEMARGLDEMIHAFAQRTDPEYSRSTYDYSNMMRVVKEVVDGHNPLDH